MRTFAIVCLGIVVALGALAGMPSVGPALAAPGTLLSDAPILAEPSSEAVSVGWLPAGAAVSIEGSPVNGFYPVTAGDVSGWLPAASLLLDQAPNSRPGIAAATPVASNAIGSGPMGPASVAIAAPILAGPGPGFGLIATAPAGSMVEQTGHLIGGYVTVQYAEVTGWAPLDHLASPPASTDPAA